MLLALGLGWMVTDARVSVVMDVGGGGSGDTGGSVGGHELVQAGVNVSLAASMWLGS